MDTCRPEFNIIGLGEQESAEDLPRSSLTAHQDLARIDAESYEWQQDLADGHYGSACLELARGRPESALAFANLALQTLRPLSTDHSDDPVRERGIEP
jgi:hypothetical protein